MPPEWPSRRCAFPQLHDLICKRYNISTVAWNRIFKRARADGERTCGTSSLRKGAQARTGFAGRAPPQKARLAAAVGAMPTPS